MKYRVTLQPQNIWQDEVVREYTAINAKHAEEVALTFNKTHTVVKSVRVGGERSTVDSLKEIADQVEIARNENNEELYQRHSRAFRKTVESLKGSMNVVSWQKAQKHIPDLAKMY